MFKAISPIVVSATIVTCSTLLQAKEPPDNAPQATGAQSSPLRNAYYGDLHLHTALSLDAYIIFGTKVTPDTAYRFARGETVSAMGQTLRRRWPLDFMAVTDHSENMGVLNALDDPGSALSKSEFGQEFLKARGKSLLGLVQKMLTGSGQVPGFSPIKASQSAWQQEIEAANRNYQPGKFTTFIAYEWTSFPASKNLHRNVIFRGDHAPYPFTSSDSDKPENLWTYLEWNRRQGIEALAIPHNADASGGLMYDWVNSDGKEIDQAYAQRRMLNEPLSEIVQAKGQSETHPLLSPNDELANFEIYEHLLVGNRNTAFSSPPGSYIRDAYGRGLVIEKKAGTNPYKFGVVGATDFHNGLSTSDENAVYPEINGGIDPAQPLPPPARISMQEIGVENLDTGSGGLTGVWAEENTRESIYAALRRKETFATSGPRLKFRFFGGWEFAKPLLKARDWVSTAYAQGVPMGGDLPVIPPGRAPKFVVWAVKDPDSGNLDRIQIIKVWLKDGQYQEKVFEVTYAGHRKPDPRTGKLPAIGNTVDLKTATYKNSIGATELSTVWEDPEFDGGVPSVYYLRVIEIPTPRWSTILAAKQGQPLPKGIPATIQERGWSSPIWYTPAKTP